MNIYCVRPLGSNIGNDLIYLCTKQFLKGVNVIRIDGLTARTIYDINRYGDGVIVGGGNFYEINDIEIDLNALRALEKPLFLFSLSYGRVINENNQFVRRTDCMPDEKIIALNNKACISSVRDNATKQYLNSLGLEPILCGCPTQHVNRFDFQLPKAEPQSLLFIRNPDLMSVPPQKRLDILQRLKTDLSIATTVACNDKRDIPFAASLGHDYIYFDDVYQYLATIKAAQNIVSYRLHATIPAYAYDIPFFNIAYDERGSSFMEIIHDDYYDVIAEMFNDYCRMCAKL